VKVVNHEHKRLVKLPKLANKPLDDRRAREARRRTDPLDTSAPAASASASIR
jgi:hypothetical protein